MDIKAFRGLSGTYNVRANERDCGNSSQNIECIVHFLNNTIHRFFIDRNCKGQVLLDCVFKHINLIETDFFGLKFTSDDTDVAISSSVSPSPALKSNPNTNGKINPKINMNTNNQSILSDENSISPQNTSSTVTSSSASSSPTPLLTSTTTKHQTHTGCSRNKNHQISTSKIASNNSDNTVSIITSSNNKINNNDSLSNNHDFSDKLTSARWLDPTKSIKKQYKNGPPYRFYFRVKFYVTDPCRLADDTTRNYLYQQLRLDIFNNRLVVPTCSAILLASYILQSELGDYKQEFFENGYISNYRLLPNQSDDFIGKVVELHKRHKSLSPADAEHNFLEHASKKLDCYGVEFYDAQDSTKTDVRIGVSSNGIIVFKDGKKVNQFSWAKILKIMFKKKVFSIQLRRDTGRENLCDIFLEFNLLTNHLCKSFWEECVAQHSFFRLHQPKSPPKKFFSFLNFGSKFQYNGKTEYQTMEESKKRSFSHFSRSPSKRYARVTLPIGRPSWAQSESEDNSHQQRQQNSSPIDNDNNNVATDYLNDTTTPGMIDDKLCRKIRVKNNNNANFLLDNHEQLCVSDHPRQHHSQHHQPVASEPARRSLNYSIPKSLTLKSFMYIDDSKNGHASDQPDNHEPTSSSANEISSADDKNQQTTIDPTPCSSTSGSTGNRKELKRSESLRLPNSIRGAISLTKKAGVSLGNQLPRLSESLRGKFFTGNSPKKINNNKNSTAAALNGISGQDRFALNGNNIHDNSIHEEIEEEEEEDGDDNNNNINDHNRDLGSRSESTIPSSSSDCEFETSSERGPRVVHLLPGKDSRYGFKIKCKQVASDNRNSLGKKFDQIRNKKNFKKVIIIENLSANSPAANSVPHLYEGDEIISINGMPIAGMSLSKVEKMIKGIQRQKCPNLALEVSSRYASIESDDDNDNDHSCRQSKLMDSDDALNGFDNHGRGKNNSCYNNGQKNGGVRTLADSIHAIKQGLASRKLIEEFERLSRKKEDETLDESRMMENMDKNRYQDILPYDSTRVQLLDSMTGDYINASFVTIPVPSQAVNRYIATQGPLASTCDDFWQMVWEQNSSLIIMVTPLIEGGRIKCHKYWPEERDEIRHGQILVKNLHEKCKAATIDRTIQLTDAKSGEKRLTTQIQYRAWPDHEVPADCRDFLKLVNRVRKHRQLYPKDPIVVHCSAGIGRTGVLILMETAVCFMESGQPIFPVKILQDMRKQRAMLIQTNSQFQFVADAICKVHDQRKHKKRKNKPSRDINNETINNISNVTT